MLTIGISKVLQERLTPATSGIPCSEGEFLIVPCCPRSFQLAGSVAHCGSGRYAGRGTQHHQPGLEGDQKAA